jgi:hypothetical protein
MHINRILIVGGYGLFGRRLAQRLSRQAGLHLIVAGRSLQAAQAQVSKFASESAASLEAAALDAMGPDFGAELLRLAPHVVVNASGPFQGQDYRVAQACIKAGLHYIDLADGREFVGGIGALNAAALAAGVLVTSGASSVPALSGAVVDQLATGMVQVKVVDIGITPGNRAERGLSTIMSVLTYCGKAIPSSGTREVIGWGGSKRHQFPAPVGSRLLSPCDVPDLVLLPGRYAGTPLVAFSAGLELEYIHRGMNLMAWAAKKGLVADWSRFAGLLKRVADLFLYFGTDAGAMQVTVEGVGSDGVDKKRSWYLMALHGDGPFVPTLAASALIRKLASGELTQRGAIPCLGMLTVADFVRETEGLHITMAEAA